MFDACDGLHKAGHIVCYGQVSRHVSNPHHSDWTYFLYLFIIKKPLSIFFFSKLCVWTVIFFYKSTSISSYYLQSLVVQSKLNWWRCNICNLPQPTSTSEGLHSYETSVGWLLEMTPTNLWFLGPFFNIDDHGSKTIKELVLICIHDFPNLRINNLLTIEKRFRL
jgi:hypothetical protein